MRTSLTSPEGTTVIIIYHDEEDSSGGEDSHDNFDILLDDASGNPIRDELFEDNRWFSRVFEIQKFGIFFLFLPRQGW